MSGAEFIFWIAIMVLASLTVGYLRAAFREKQDYITPADKAPYKAPEVDSPGDEGFIMVIWYGGHD